MHSVSRKRDLSLGRGYSHFNRFAHYGSTDPASTGSYLSQPQVWYLSISSFLLPEAALASALGPNTTEHLCLQSIWHPVLPQLHYKPSLCQHWNKHLERKKKKIWRYLMRNKQEQHKNWQDFRNQTPAISLLSSVLFSVLTLLFQYYSTMFVCFLFQINCSSIHGMNTNNISVAWQHHKFLQTMLSLALPNFYFFPGFKPTA